MRNFSLPNASRRAVCPFLFAQLDRHGQPVEHKYVDYKIVCDERIVDGAYYAAAFKHMKYYLKNPQELERAPEKVLDDIF